MLIEHPIDAWIGGRGTGGETYFAFKADSFHTTFEVAPAVRSTFIEMAREIIDWRLAQYLDRAIREPEKKPEGDKPEGQGIALELWQTYCGVVAFQKWEGEKPITVTWKLSSPVPDHLRRLFKIEL